MNESMLERIQSSAKALKIDLYTAELASYADEKELTPEALEAICGVFEYLEQKKYDSMVHTMLKLSKLPMNQPKTLEKPATVEERFLRRVKRSEPRQGERTAERLKPLGFKSKAKRSEPLVKSKRRILRSTDVR